MGCKVLVDAIIQAVGWMIPVISLLELRETMMKRSQRKNYLDFITIRLLALKSNFEIFQQMNPDDDSFAGLKKNIIEYNVEFVDKADEFLNLNFDFKNPGLKQSLHLYLQSLRYPVFFNYFNFNKNSCFIDIINVILQITDAARKRKYFFFGDFDFNFNPEKKLVDELFRVSELLKKSK